MLAAKAGAKYVSPFAGRVDDYIRSKLGMSFEKHDYFPQHGMEKDGTLIDDNGIVSGIDLVAKCVKVLQNYGFETEVIAASMRNARQAREAALVGAHIATLPLSVIREMLIHHKTAEGMKKFLDDAPEEYERLMS